MIASLIALAGCVFLLGHLAGPLLLRTSWSAGLPGTTVALWAAAVAGAVLALAGLAGLGLVLPSTPGHRLIDWIADCLPKDGHGISPLAVLATALVLAAGAMALRLAVPRIARTVRGRREHREMLDMVARDLVTKPDVRVLDHPMPLIYCLPARERPIVVTTGALERLEPAEVEAVLAHERAHLRQRHHLILVLADALSSAIPWLGTLRLAHTTLPGLLELAADDHAARRHGRAPLIGALQKMAITSCSAGALAVNPATAQIAKLRIARLSNPSALPRVPHAKPLSWLAIVAALGVPATLATLAVMMLPLPC
ncbi:M56 family metallopeptidase [Microbispora sp. H10836]|uniref:M56 family metallopeptidase n=1 Tax=Microbispora sp. H10836 TaxID=2729106 RepID=UPI0014764EF7|nr:M56 family metallopeptidase [Microbispora sp. H10836]